MAGCSQGQGAGYGAELAAAGGWPSVSRFLWFIDGAAEGVQFDADMLAEARALLMGGMAIS